MKLPAYPKYKSSGVEWLGAVPEGWGVVRLGYLADKVGSGKTPRGGAETYQSEGVLLIRSQNVHDTGVRLADAVYIDESVDEEMAATRVLPGDVLLNITGASLGRCSIAPDDLPRANVNQHVCIVRVERGKARPPFIQRALASRAVQEQIFSFENGSSREGLNFQQVRSLLLAVPPPLEQTGIAESLDRETGKIETLVAKKRTLVERLKEKRTALISRTVTRGLSPDAARAAGLDPRPKLKPSGIDWLGDVPAHWALTRLKYAAALIVDCPHETPTYSEDGEYFVIRTADLTEGRMDLTAAYHLDEDEFRRRIRREPLLPGDVVYGREGERWGFAALVPDNPTTCLGQRMMQFRVAGHFDAAFLMWQLNGTSVYKQGAVDTVGSTSPHVNVETIRNYWLSQPPLHEQRAIADLLDRGTGRIDGMIAKVESVIDRLQEYRTALITAAVTGKIDVRQLAAKGARA